MADNKFFLMSKLLNSNLTIDATLQAILEITPNGIVIIDTNGSICFVNKQYVQMLGYEANELIGQKASITMPPTSLATMRKQLKEIINFKAKEGIALEIQQMHSDGHSFPVEITYCYLRQDEEITGVMIYVRNLTQYKQQQSQLQQFQEMARQSPNSVIITDNQGIIEYVNPQFCKFTGYTTQEAIGKNPRFLKSGVHPTSYYQVLWDTIKAGKKWQKDICNRKKDGSLYWELQSITPILNEHGEITHYLAIKVEDTKHKQTEEKFKAQTQQQTVLFNLSIDLISALDQADICQKIIERLYTTLSYNHVAIFLIDENTKEWVMWASMGLPDIVPYWRIKMGESISKRPLKNGQFHYISDLKTESNCLPGFKTGCEVDIPLSIENKMIGVLIIGNKQPNSFNKDDFLMLMAVANQTAIALQRIRTHQSVKEAEDRYQQLIDISPYAIIIHSDGKLVYVNLAAIKLFKANTAEDLVGKQIMNFIHPDYKTLVNKRIRKIEQEGEKQLAIEEKLICLDGSVIDVEIAGMPFIYHGKVATQTVIRDITEYKKSAETLRRRNRELAMLNQIIAASVDGQDTTVILETVCRELAVAFNFPQASATLFNTYKTIGIQVADYVNGDSPIVLKHLSSLQEDPVYQHLIAYKTPFAANANQNETYLLPVPTWLQQQGITAILALPLVVDDNLIGMLNLISSHTQLLSIEEIQLAWRVAEQVAGVLARIELRKSHEQLEAQYRQSQKMEAVGLLADGIAHDFNNLLTGINGFAELLQRKLSPDDSKQHFAKQILRSGQKAADLVRQLLTFSRNQVIKPQTFNCNDIVTKMIKMLKPIIGENIELQTNLASNLWSIEMDPGQLEQIIINMAVNARDAMPQGGLLTIETHNISLQGKYVTQYLDTQPGDYIVLVIADTGCGMSADVKEHIFEPFFTTKDIGKGSGLGLATVFGIVKQSKGNIWVYSEVNYGTTFKIYLPRINLGFQHELSLEDNNIPTGTETILLVEDNEIVRQLAERVLKGQGYTLLQAENGYSALQLARQHNKPIHLLLTDVVMPNMSGQILAQKLIKTEPNLKVLFMSGYTDSGIENKHLLDAGGAFLEKPFDGATLARKVRTVLDGDS